MALRKIEQVKNDRGFKPFDLIIYGVIILMIVTAFLAVYFLSDRRELTGIRVLYNSSTIYEYEFGHGEVLSSEHIEYVESGEVIVIRVNLREGYNILRIDTRDRAVSITDADCNSRSCVHMPSMTNNSGTIICQTHYLVVTPLIQVDDGNIII